MNNIVIGDYVIYREILVKAFGVGLIVSLIITILAVLIQVKKMKNVHEKREAHDYISRDLNLIGRHRTYLYTDTSRRKIEKDDD